MEFNLNNVAEINFLMWMEKKEGVIRIKEELDTIDRLVQQLNSISEKGNNTEWWKIETGEYDNNRRPIMAYKTKQEFIDTMINAGREIEEEIRIEYDVLKSFVKIWQEENREILKNADKPIVMDWEFCKILIKKYEKDNVMKQTDTNDNAELVVKEQTESEASETEKDAIEPAAEKNILPAKEQTESEASEAEKDAIEPAAEKNILPAKEQTESEASEAEKDAIELATEKNISPAKEQLAYENLNQNNKTAKIKLSKDEIILELLQILKENNMPQQARNIQNSASYVDELEDKVTQMIKEIESMRQEILSNQQKSAPAEDAINTVRDNCKKTGSKITSAKESMKSNANIVIENFKKKGKSALKEGAEFVCKGVRGTLESVRKYVQAGIEDTNKTLAKLDGFTSEKREAGQHFANSIRSLSGKELVNYTQKEEETSLIRKPWAWQKKTYQGFEKTLSSAINKLNESIEKIHEEPKKRRSIRELLDDCEKNLVLSDEKQPEATYDEAITMKM